MPSKPSDTRREQISQEKVAQAPPVEVVEEIPLFPLLTLLRLKFLLHLGDYNLPGKKLEKEKPLKPAAEKPGIVDDFRQAKNHSEKAPPPPPIKKLPVSREDAKVEEKKPAAEEAKEERVPTEAEKAATQKPALFKDFRDVRSQRKPDQKRSFDVRDRMGLRESEDDRWRKKRHRKFMDGSKKTSPSDLKTFNSTAHLSERSRSRNESESLSADFKTLHARNSPHDQRFSR